MSELNWALARQGVRLITGDEEAPDGITPDLDEQTDGNIALLVEGCAIYGQPAELLELLSDGIAKVSAHLAGQQ